MSWARRCLVFAPFALALLLLGCGGGGNSPVGSSPTPSTTPNVQAIQVNSSPTAQAGDYSAVNSAFTSVTICLPGTTQCQTIGGILVDTGSEGLRVLSSALSLTLPTQTQNGNPVGECAPFVGGITWGPVETADVEMAGEKASSVPIQVIGGGTGVLSGVPAPLCTNMGAPDQDLATLGANGILGVGIFAQDCRVSCTYPVSSGANLDWYYSCPSSGCQVTTESLTQQVENPVVAFPTDNNGVIIELPALPAGPPPIASTVNGSLIFGIGTQSNNGLNGATVYQVDSAYGNFSVVFPVSGASSTLYSDVGFIDSGSGALYFADPSTAGIPCDCGSSGTGLYTPGNGVALGDTALSATNVGINGTSGTFNFTVEDGDYLLYSGAYPNDIAFADLAGPSTTVSGPSTSDYFDWGLPFFYGRNVYTAIEGQGTPGGPGPYYAY